MRRGQRGLGVGGPAGAQRTRIYCKVDACPHAPAQTLRMHITERELDMNCGLWVMMHQCRFVAWDKGTSLVGMSIMGEAVHVQGQREMGNVCNFLSILL